MKILRYTAILAVFFLAACANPDRFGAGANGGLGGLGSPGDPASPAYFQATVGDRVFFEVDQSTLSASGRATLDGQAQWLLDNPDYAAVIEGHADERGTTEYNIALGARRASAVQEYLFAQGIALGRLQTVSFGKERPVEICSDEICYAQNRRGVTVLGPAAGV